MKISSNYSKLFLPVFLFVMINSHLAYASEPKPLAVPKIKELIQPWIFARASESSMLFLDKSFKGREPYGHLVVLGKEKYRWLEYDGIRTTLWDIVKIERTDKQLTLYFAKTDTDKAQSPPRLVIYPYWDIDNCLVMILFNPEAEENPVRFSTPYSKKEELPYLLPEG